MHSVFEYIMVFVIIFMLVYALDFVLLFFFEFIFILSLPNACIREMMMPRIECGAIHAFYVSN